MGRKSDLTSDPALARSHKTGSKVAVLQLSEHERLGTIAMLWPRYWVLHFDYARRALGRLRGCHSRIAALPLKPSNTRDLYEPRLRSSLYRAGSELVINAALAAQHLACEMERYTKESLHSGPVEARLKTVAKKAGLLHVVKAQGYDQFHELVQARDAFEHPKQSNVYSADVQRWANVPIAWFASERSIVAGEGFTAWFTNLANAWVAAIPQFATGPATIDVVRGIRSNRRAAKKVLRMPPTV